ncbi:MULTISPECIES: hypothetical protein [Paenibacillus]|uniref:Uncharacterized protein n=1 Tax=Paenibacillus polymyxa TaxID=1406 RepID=A0AAP4E9S6_PAEPO|nr:MULTISPECIES: hypothetical protein [Paenibacillus]MCP3777795.1 hypothetical protein [Paenibacillus sp. MZ03-122A]MCP3806801.1 hypothetical protein [Paenibacillus sp. Lou8.1]MDH2331235.1 hypothetical protein [Paenibacillus polymyxa]OMF80575.1 hypothetical protein BK145_09785 [Paenibacillus peoriae]SFR16837.1 hypothetical protein SAMN04488603_104283 [Paenibacillus sp. cl130]
MKFTKKLIKSLAVVAIIGSISASAYASSTIEGGWIEGEGNFSNNISHQELSLRAAKSVPDHQGYTEAKPGNSDLERAVAITKWEGEYHYSRAQLTWAGSVRLDSDRQWGWDRTRAVTGYGEAILVARTFYGGSQE